MKRSAILRFYAELNDRLPPERRQRDFELAFDGPHEVASLLSALGVPSDAVELVLVNGVSRSLDYLVQNGDRVSLYPTFESVDVSPLLQLRDSPLRRVAFIADAHLGRLARYLRLLGFDTLFENDPGDEALAEIAANEGRILLSRDRALLERRIVTHGLWVPAVRPSEQLAYVLDRLDLYRLLQPFTRCTVCNGLLAVVDKEQLDKQVPPRVLAVFDDFWRCTACGRIYWQGSHYDRLRRLVEQVVTAGPDRFGPNHGAVVPE
ncbi:MAG: Mut7-C RNAse domain-containing protein [Chromatiaceae bacterium]